MDRNISTLKLSKYIIKRLNDQGIVYCHDLIQKIDSINLSSEIKNEIWLAMKCGAIKSVLTIAEEENKIQKIPTFCKQLDDLLNGGIHLQHLTEFCGSPGSGKTQFVLQLSVSVQIPHELGGLQSKAVFICTNSGFSTKRLAEIASFSISHCNNIVELSQENSHKNALKNFTIDSILSGVYYQEVTDYVQLVATIEILKKFVREKPVKLIVIDSISFLFRYGVPMLLRTKLLYKIIIDLQKLALETNIAVVVTNEITTRPFGGHDGLVPALGESYAHMVPTRILLGTGSENERVALIDKSTNISKEIASFQISEKGIRDCAVEIKF